MFRSSELRPTCFCVYLPGQRMRIYSSADKRIKQCRALVRASQRLAIHPRPYRHVPQKKHAETPAIECGFASILGSRPTTHED